MLFINNNEYNSVSWFIIVLYMWISVIGKKQKLGCVWIFQQEKISKSTQKMVHLSQNQAFSVC